MSRNYPAPTWDHKLQEFLVAHRGTTRFLAATQNSRLAAPLIIATGEPVMAAGGYFGFDPILTADAFAAMVERGEVRYVLLGRRRQGPVALWTVLHGERVDDSEWRSLSPDWESPLTLYDVKPR